jgi:hypothetical protein
MMDTLRREFANATGQPAAAEDADAKLPMHR